MEFVDKKGIIRAKIHPADKVTPTNHLHLYDSNGTSLNSILNRVTHRSAEAHIPIK